jgi:vitamin K-dependent gamma-carboxylase
MIEPGKLPAFLARPVDVAFLAALRFLYGATMCISMVRFIAYGWIDDFFVRPKFHFKYWGFGWVEPLSASGMHALFWVLAALGFSIAVGFCFRVAITAFVLGFAYLQLLDVTNYLNHYYLAALLGLLLAFSPAHRAFSVDAWRSRQPALETVPAFWLWLFRFQIGVVYTFAGLAKANADWLVHAQPLRIWLASRTGLPVIGHLFSLPYAPLAMSWAGFLFDTIVLWFLLIPRVRLLAFGVVIVFHVLTRLLFPIGMFPVIMVTSALVFFPPDWPRRLLRRAAVARVEVAQPMSRLGLGLAAVYCILQIALPLRFLVYGDNVRWHEQGMRFSWRVMVREKNGSITFVVRDKTDGRTWHVNPHTILTALQEREMSGQPDLILQLAHYIKEDFARRGHDVEVHVDAVASLNGRRLAPMIDPNVDLAKVDDGIGQAWWIMPSPTEPPPHIRPI